MMSTSAGFDNSGILCYSLSAFENSALIPTSDRYGISGFGAVYPRVRIQPATDVVSGIQRMPAHLVRRVATKLGRAGLMEVPSGLPRGEMI
jgi:hypothetical protein